MFTICALYKFSRLDDFDKMQRPLRDFMDTLNVRGTLLLAREGINGTISGSDSAINKVLDYLNADKRLSDLEYKFSYSETIPFKRLKVKLKEEIGYGANKFTFLKTITLAPGYQSNTTHIVLAEDLYEEMAEGDEPEPLEIVSHKLSNLEKLTYDEDLTEARSILALYMVREIIRNR